MNKLRLLNFDDLFLLRLLLQDATITSIARQLGLTQPAVTQRLRKVERVFDVLLMQRSGRTVRLTDEGRAICNKAAMALALMGEVATEPSSQVVNVGTRPEAGWSWLWPALARLRRKNPEILYHCHFGSGEEILRHLGGGRLDVVLTSAPLTVRDFRAIDVAVEEYVLVAAPVLADTIHGIEDLREHLLVEHDRSFPFHRYLDATSRATLRYRDVWFVGSSTLMIEAVLEGLGVGIVPLYLAKKGLEKGKLRHIIPSVRIEPDTFRLVYRQSRGLDAAVELLADELKRLGLR